MNITNRERFKAIAHSRRRGDLWVSDMIFPETAAEWVKQGAPPEIAHQGPPEYWGNQYFQKYFGHDSKEWILKVKSGLIAEGNFGSPLVPSFEKKLITEDERTQTYINPSGQTEKVLKGRKFSMPMFIDWPVKDRATWNELKKRLDPNTPERWPEDWDAYVKELNSLDRPVILQVGSFFGYLRNWIGSERILYMFYDDPGLIEDMMDHMLYLETEIIKRVVKDIKVDEADYWEDMAYKAGPLISPDMVKKYMVPRYKKITELLHQNGIDIIYVDSDGNIEKLIPLWLESGVNYVWPLEQTAGNDIIALKKKYGRDLILSGGIDKRCLLKGKDAIREEVMSKVPYLLEQGGYFPTLDHMIPPGATLENYCYYINTLREIGGLAKISF